MWAERFRKGDLVKPKPGVLEPGTYECGDRYEGTRVIRLRKLPEKAYRFATADENLNPANQNEEDPGEGVH